MLTSILCMLNSSINNQRLMNQTSLNACRRLNSNFNSISNKDDENNGKVDMSWEYFLRKNAKKQMKNIDKNVKPILSQLSESQLANTQLLLNDFLNIEALHSLMAETTKHPEQINEITEDDLRKWNNYINWIWSVLDAQYEYYGNARIQTDCTPREGWRSNGGVPCYWGMKIDNFIFDYEYSFASGFDTLIAGNSEEFYKDRLQKIWNGEIKVDYPKKDN